MSRKLSVSIVLAATLVPAVALAFILPADAILARSAKMRAQLGLTTLRLEGTRTKADGTKERFREVLRSGKGRKIETLVDGVAVNVQLVTQAGKLYQYNPKQGPGAPTKAPVDPIVRFLLEDSKDPGGRRGMSFLANAGINHEITTMGRQERRLAFVIGAKPWEGDKPQLWLDQTTYVPLKLITRSNGKLMETRLLGFGSPLTQSYFPRIVERYEDGKLVERTTYETIELNPKLDDEALSPG